MGEEAAALSITGKLRDALIPQIPTNSNNSKQLKEIQEILQSIPKEFPKIIPLKNQVPYKNQVPHKKPSTS